jgi:hypothetical protein
MIDPLSEFVITAVLIGATAWFVSWLVQMLLPEIYLPACIVVGAVALILILYQFIGLLRGVPDWPDIQDGTPSPLSTTPHEGLPVRQSPPEASDAQLGGIAKQL